MDSPRFGLPPRLFVEAFPFHLALDGEMRLVQFGPALARACPGLAAGMRLDEAFRITRPEEMPIDLAAIRARPRALFLLEARHGSLKLKGQMMGVDEERVILFLCSPWITDAAELASLGLSRDDFAVHAPLEDHLCLPSALDAVVGQAILGRPAELYLEGQEMLARAPAPLFSDGHHELREREERFRQLAENIREVFWLVTATGQIIYVSPAFEEVWGRPVRDLLERPAETFMAALHPDDAAQAFSSLEQLEGGDESEYRIIRPDGSIRHIHSRSFPIRNERGELYRIAGIAEDVTQRKNVERALREREEKFRQLAENIREVFWLADTSTHEMLWVSPAYEDIFGRPLLELFRRPKSWFDAVHPDDVETARAAMSGGEAREFEYRIVRPDGSVRWIQSRAFAISDDDGQTYRIAGIAEDVTHRKEAEQALRRSEREFREVIERIPDGVTFSRDERYVWVNATFARFLGYERPEQLAGTPVCDHVVPDERDVVRERMRRFMETGVPPPPREGRMLRTDGETVILEIAPVQLLQFEGATAALVVSRDVTERKKIQSGMLIADRMASVGTLAAGVAHEINNPLAYVTDNLGFIDENLSAVAALMPEALRLATEQAVRDARDGAERVRVIVRDLKTFSRGDEESLGPVEVKRVLECSISMARNEIRHRARLVRDYGDVPHVDGNEARLGQVFLNLIVNATQAIPEGNADDNEIGVATRTDGAGNVVVEVRDSGQGIAPEHRARLFDPFFTTKPVGVGTGLGLSICHNIIAAHGGTIEVESEVGKGSVFRVILRPSAIVTAFEEPPAPPPPGRRGRILVVDDEPMVVASVARLLSPEHEVVTVTAARDALTRLDEGDRFDLILCDLMMPEMTGMDLLEELARTHPDQAERMVFTTGGAFTPRAQEFLDATPHPRIEKPFTSQGLRAVVRSQLARFPRTPARTDAEPAPRPAPVDEEARPTGRRRRAAKASAS